MARKFRIPAWLWLTVAVVAIVAVVCCSPAVMSMRCPPSQYYCPGVGCLSGQDKCFTGARGGPSKVFSKETFKAWPGSGVKSSPPEYDGKETFVNRKCPDGTKSDGPCLMEFPDS